MLRKSLNLFAVSVTLALAISSASAANTPSTAKLSAAAVVEKNIAARGGLQAWKAVHTMTFTGKMGVGGNRRPTLAIKSPDPKADPSALPQRPAEEAQLPFELDMARGRKTRLELTFNGQKAIQVYDGSKGWKVRPYLNHSDAEPFTADELKAASLQTDLDGPLMDYAVKGTKIEMEGMDKVENRDTYKLKLTMKSGQELHVWIDAQTFLEAKIDGQPRRLDGVMHSVEVYYRDYRAVNGLQIPFVLETKVLPVEKTALGTKDTPQPPEKIALENVVVNPKLEDSRFSKPEMAMASKVN